MKKTLVVLLLTFLFSFGANAMLHTITSKTFVLESKQVTTKNFVIKIHSGNVTIEKGGNSTRVDYYFEYKGKQMTEEKAEEMFSKCTANISNGIFTAECPKPSTGWINANYHVTIPTNLSLAVFVDSGNLTIKNIALENLNINFKSGNLTVKNSQIAGAFNCMAHSGNLSITDSKLHGDSSIDLRTGKIDIDNSVFESKTGISLKSGKISFKYIAKKTGSIIYTLWSKTAHTQVTPATGCKIESGTLICNPKLGEININLESGLIDISPTK